MNKETKDAFDNYQKANGGLILIKFRGKKFDGDT